MKAKTNYILRQGASYAITGTVLTFVYGLQGINGAVWGLATHELLAAGNKRAAVGTFGMGLGLVTLCGIGGAELVDAVMIKCDEILKVDEWRFRAKLEEGLADYAKALKEDAETAEEA